MSNSYCFARDGRRYSLRLSHQAGSMLKPRGAEQQVPKEVLDRTGKRLILPGAGHKPFERPALQVAKAWVTRV